MFKSRKQSASVTTPRPVGLGHKEDSVNQGSPNATTKPLTTSEGSKPGSTFEIGALRRHQSLQEGPQRAVLPSGPASALQSKFGAPPPSLAPPPFLPRSSADSMPPQRAAAATTATTTSGGPQLPPPLPRPSKRPLAELTPLSLPGVRPAAAGPPLPPRELTAPFLAQPQSAAVLPAQERVAQSWIPKPKPLEPTPAALLSNESPRSSKARRTNSQKCLSPGGAEGGRAAQSNRFSTLARGVGAGSIFRSNSETLKAAVQYITGGTLAQSFGSPVKGQSYYDAAGSLEVLQVVLEAMQGELKCNADDFQNLVVLHETASFELRVPILKTMLAAYGLSSAVGHLARWMTRETLPRVGSYSLTRRGLMNALTGLVFEAEGSVISRRELPNILVNNLVSFLSCLKDTDAQIQTGLTSVFTCAGVDIFDCLLSLSCSKVHGYSIAAPLDLLLKCLATDIDPPTRELALISFLHIGSAFSRVVREAHDEERVLLQVAEVVRDDRSPEMRLLAVSALNALRQHTPCFVAEAVEALSEASRKDRSEEVRRGSAALLKSLGVAEEPSAHRVLASPSPRMAVSRLPNKDHQLYILEATAALGADRCSVAAIHGHIHKHHPQLNISFEAIKTILRTLEEKRIVSKSAATYRIRK